MRVRFGYSGGKRVVYFRNVWSHGSRHDKRFIQAETAADWYVSHVVPLDTFTSPEYDDAQHVRVLTEYFRERGVK